ncbi:MAG: hypothetical protein ACI3XA_04590 [Clostridia bacterium]
MARKYDENTQKNIQGIVNEKSKWHAAYDAGDEEGMSAAREAAKSYYKSLTDSGNYDVAKELQNSDYDKARGYLEEYKGTKPKDDNRSLEVENMRNATDTAKDHGDFANRSADEIFEANKKQNERIDSNPMDTDAARAIMDRYKGLGEDAYKDTLADGSVKSDGNLDSFAKANGDRQREAYEKAGIESVFDLHERNINAGNENNKTLGSNISIVDNVYSNAEAGARSNAQAASENENNKRITDVNVQKMEADITGEVPEALQRKNNIFFNDDGTLKDENLDYQAIINDAKARGDENTAQHAEYARAWKIINNPDYAEYAPSIVAPNPNKTEAARQFDENVQLEREGNELSKYSIDTSATLQRESEAAELRKLAAQAEADGKRYLAAAYIAEAERIENRNSGANPQVQEGKGENTAEQQIVQNPQQDGTVKIVNKPDYAIANPGITNPQAEVGSENIRPTVGKESTSAITSGEVTPAVKTNPYAGYPTKITYLPQGAEATESTPETLSPVPKTTTKTTKTTNKSNQPLSDKEIKAFVDSVNNEVSNWTDGKLKGLVPDGKNGYKRTNVESGYVIQKVFESEDLTQKQKEYLLYDKLGITEEQVKAALEDRDRNRG